MEVMERGTSNHPEMKKSESWGNLSGETQVTEPTCNEYSASNQEYSWTKDDDKTLSSLLDDEIEWCNEADETDSHDELPSSSEQFVFDEDVPNLSVPSEIFVINQLQNCEDYGVGCLDMAHRLEAADVLVRSYKAKVESTENLVDSLHLYLRRTQSYAERLLQERSNLISVIQEMERMEESKREQGFVLKMLLCCSLFFYFCGGSEYCLIAVVALNLMYEFVSQFA